MPAVTVPDITVLPKVVADATAKARRVKSVTTAPQGFEGGSGFEWDSSRCHWLDMVSDAHGNGAATQCPSEPTECIPCQGSVSQGVFVKGVYWCSAHASVVCTLGKRFKGLKARSIIFKRNVLLDVARLIRIGETLTEQMR